MKPRSPAIGMSMDNRRKNEFPENSGKKTFNDSNMKSTVIYRFLRGQYLDYQELREHLTKAILNLSHLKLKEM